MLDIQTETLISLADAAKLLPGLRPGTRMNAGSVRRLAARGVRGVRLETVMAGGRRCTSADAVQRFITRLTEGADAKSADCASKTRRRPGVMDARKALLLRHGIQY